MPTCMKLKPNQTHWGRNYLFKNLKSGFYRLISKKKRRNMIINEEVMTNYLEQIVLLLNEILDVSIPFEEKV
jgi:hypothetical protein